MNVKTVAIVPAYNEEPRIAAVLEVILSSPRVDETVVVDDGSEDGTGRVAGHFPVKLLQLEQNRGKGAAMQAGLDHVRGAKNYLFLDADLVNLQHEHIEELLKPMDDPATAMAIGVFRAGNKNSVNLAQHYFSILNGQRALSQEFVNILPDLRWSRFGVEILLTRYARMTQKKVAYPELQGITHVTKEEKLGFYQGFLYRLQMYRECLYSLFNHKKMIKNHPGNVPENLLQTL